MGVLRAAVFGALTSIRAGLVRLNTDAVHLAGNEIDLAVQSRNEERMDYIIGSEVDIHRLADGDVNFVGGGDVLVERTFHIVDLPPPLVAGDPYIGGHRHLMVFSFQ